MLSLNASGWSPRPLSGTRKALFCATRGSARASRRVTAASDARRPDRTRSDDRDALLHQFCTR